MPHTARLLLGLALVVAGGVLVFSPLAVARVLGRPQETSSQRINLRATWGGTVLGLGALVAGLPALQPWRRAGLAALLCSMVGIGLARLVGFALDGRPDRLQWVWLVAEAVLAALAAAGLWWLAA